MVMGDGDRRRVKSSAASPRTFQNSAKFSSVLCSLDRLTSLSTSPKWTGKFWPGPGTPPQAHSARLQRRATHCSPGPELPFLVLSTTHPHPELRILSLVGCQAVCTPIGRSTRAERPSPQPSGRFPPALPRRRSPPASLRSSRVPDQEAKPENGDSGCGGEVAFYLAN